MATIFAADDDPSILSIYVIALGRRHHTVRTFATVADLASALQSETPDLIILDGSLSTRQDGFVYATQLRATTPPYRVLLIAVGDVNTNYSVLAPQYNLPYLSKPFTITELYHTVADLLSRQP